MCASCGKTEEAPLCAECRRKFDEAYIGTKAILKKGNGFIDEFFYLFPYSFKNISALLIDIKRNNIEDAYNALIPYIKKGLKKCGFIDKCDFITFSPRSIINGTRYGFDQAEEFAKIISEIAELPLKKSIKRRKLSFSQHNLSSKMREVNVRKAFDAIGRFDGQNILLIDDIVTTGATANEAARILKSRGAMKVFVFSMAH